MESDHKESSTSQRFMRQGIQAESNATGGPPLSSNYFRLDRRLLDHVARPLARGLPMDAVHLHSR